MDMKSLHSTATDEDINSLWYLYKEQQLKSARVGPPSHMKRGLNVRDGMFNLRVAWIATPYKCQTEGRPSLTHSISREAFGKDSYRCLVGVCLLSLLSVRHGAGTRCCFLLVVYLFHCKFLLWSRCFVPQRVFFGSLLNALTLWLCLSSFIRS